MEVKVGAEIRRYVTFTVNVDKEDEAPAALEQAVKDEHPDLDWNEPEIDYVEILNVLPQDNASDRACEERREAILYA